MRLYLARHGESVAEGNDDERPLSPKGEEDIQRLADFMLPLKIKVTTIMQSEKFRAQQTAKILATSIQTKSLETVQELDPLASPAIIIKHLYAEKKDVLLVGHMPFMGKLVGQLLTGSAAKNVVAFKTGSLVCLEEIEYKQWVISWMLNPGLLFINK